MFPFHKPVITPSEFITWRENLGKSQEEMAEFLGVDKSAIYKWEAKVNRIPPMLKHVMVDYRQGLEPIFVFPTDLDLNEKREVGEWVEIVREKLGLTQQELAMALFSDLSTYRKWRNGTNRIPPYLPLVLSGLFHSMRKPETP